MKRLLFLLPFLLALSACASNSLTRTEQNKLYSDYIQTHQLEELDKIKAFKFYGWWSLNNEYLIITTSPRKRYLIQLRSSCVDLSFTRSIAIAQTGSHLYSRFDSISTLDFPAQKCFIKSIYRVTKEQANEIDQLGKQEAQG